MQVIFEMIFIANLWTGAEHPAFSTNSGGSGKKYWGGAGPSSFGRQQWLSEITIEPPKFKNLGGDNNNTNT